MKLAVVAADYTPGEADQLRRDMAAWRKSGRIERHRELLISRMAKKGIALEFAQRVFEQIRGFGEYGFPESHAASFALISYATAYLRRHHPAEFTCALLNAQPMGFYMPSTIVEDAGRMGVEVRPVDVARSDWDCTLEDTIGLTGGTYPSKLSGHVPPSRPTIQNPDPTRPIRMGLRYVKGLSREAGTRIVATRGEAPFEGIEDLSRRAGLDSGAMDRLSESGAFRSLEVTRRQALWESKGASRTRLDTLPIPTRAPSPDFDDLSPFEDIAWDYVSSGHSTAGHPLGPLRRKLTGMGIPDAVHLADIPHGRTARYVGMVICRQRPSTASGVVFMTLEDETGFVNLVCWKDVFARHEILAKTSPLLGVTGEIQSQDGVTHLIARELWRPPLKLGDASTRSRDFR